MNGNTSWHPPAMVARLRRPRAAAPLLRLAHIAAALLLVLAQDATPTPAPDGGGADGGGGGGGDGSGRGHDMSQVRPGHLLSAGVGALVLVGVILVAGVGALLFA